MIFCIEELCFSMTARGEKSLESNRMLKYFPKIIQFHISRVYLVNKKGNSTRMKAKSIPCKIFEGKKHEKNCKYCGGSKGY